jgi:hypothetical protein
MNKTIGAAAAAALTAFSLVTPLQASELTNLDKLCNTSSNNTSLMMPDGAGNPNLIGTKGNTRECGTVLETLKEILKGNGTTEIVVTGIKEVGSIFRAFITPRSPQPVVMEQPEEGAEQASAK